MTRIGDWGMQLLGRGLSKDVDIAVDNMTGLAFLERLNDYLKQHHHSTHRIGKIKSNPEKSKHLDTGTTRIDCGSVTFDVDFVNLRAEEYTHHSRVPSVRFGTPLEDAQRRDLTINSLFYNINERRVEDFTGLVRALVWSMAAASLTVPSVRVGSVPVAVAQGLRDLRDGIIRTPLAPQETFLDDPLRVLRTIRFASRLHFRIEPSVEAALANPAVLAMLAAKVSRERVTRELEGILRDAVKHLHLLAEGGRLEVSAAEAPLERCVMFGRWLCADALHEAVFLRPAPGLLDASPPPEVDPTLQPRLELSKALVAAVAAPAARPDPGPRQLLLGVAGAVQCVLHRSRSWAADADITTALIGACLLHLRRHWALDSRQMPVPLCSWVARESLKLPTKELEAVCTAMETAAQLLTAPRTRLDIGRLLRNARDAWRASVLLAGAHPCCPLEPLLDFVEHEGLVDVHRVPPLLTGTDIMRELHASGRQVGLLLNRAVEWQLAHPRGTASECVAALRQMPLPPPDAA